MYFKNKPTILAMAALAILSAVAGCGKAGQDADQAQIRASHIKPGLTVQQRIDKVNANPDLTPDQKAMMTARIKTNPALQSPGP